MTAAELLTMTVADVLASYEEAATVFLDRGMGCVGCPFARFETVAEAAAVYHIEPLELAAAILEAGHSEEGHYS